MGAQQNDSAVETLLSAAAKAKETPAQLQSRRHAVGVARDTPEAAAEHLETVWEIYFAEIERPVSVADEFAQIDDYSTDIRATCAEVFLAVTETDGQQFTGHQSDLLRALRMEPVEPIRETLVETAGSLVERGTVPDEDLVDVLCEVGKTTEETGTVDTVAGVLGTYADSRFDESVQRHAASALESIAKNQGRFRALLALRELGQIAVDNGYDDISITAVDRLAAVVDHHLSAGDDGDELAQQIHDAFLTVAEADDWTAVESTYLLEAAVDTRPVVNTEMMGPLLEAGVELDDEGRLRELMELVSDQTFDSGGMIRFGALTELGTIGTETTSTAGRREVLAAFDQIVRESDALHPRLVATLRIGEVGECSEDTELRRDAIAMLERALDTDEYLARSAAADALGDVAASSTSISLLNRVLDVLRVEFTDGDPEPLHSARKSIRKLGIRTDDPEVQATVLALVRSLASRNHDGAVEILKDASKLLEALDQRLAPEALDVIRAAMWNDHSLVSASGVQAVSGAWLAAQPAETQQAIRRTLFDAALHDDTNPVKKQEVIKTHLEFVDEGGDSQLLVPVLRYLAAADHDMIRLFAMATLARQSTDRADAILGSLLQDDEIAENTVNIGMAWGRGDLPVDPPSPATDHEDALKALNVAAASEQERNAQIVLSELQFVSTPDADMALSPADDLDVVVAHALTSGTLRFRRETVDLIQDYADGFRPSLRRRLVETLALGITDDSQAVGNATADAVAKLCLMTDDRQTWERGIQVLRTGITDRRGHAVSGAAEALAEMAASAPADTPTQPIREALYAAIVNGGQIAAVAAVKGIAEIGSGALDLQQLLVSTPECRSTLGKASRDSSLSDREVSVAIDLAVTTGASTSISPPSVEE